MPTIRTIRTTHQMTVSGTVVANRLLTVGPIGTVQTARVMLNAPITTTIASGSDVTLDDDNHSTRVNTVAAGTASDGNATVAYQGTPLAAFNGASQERQSIRELLAAGRFARLPRSGAALLSDGEASSVGAAVQPAVLDYNVAVLANRVLTVGAIGTGGTAA